MGISRRGSVLSSPVTGAPGPHRPCFHGLAPGGSPGHAGPGGSMLLPTRGAGLPCWAVGIGLASRQLCWSHGKCLDSCDR